MLTKTQNDKMLKRFWTAQQPDNAITTRKGGLADQKAKVVSHSQPVKYEKII
jgi:hypothetical protein